MLTSTDSRNVTMASATGSSSFGVSGTAADSTATAGSSPAADGLHPQSRNNEPHDWGLIQSTTSAPSALPFKERDGPRDGETARHVVRARQSKRETGQNTERD